MQAAAQFLTRKGYDLDNLPAVEHHYQPIIQQRQAVTSKVPESLLDDEESEDNLMMMQYLKDRRSRDNIAGES